MVPEKTFQYKSALKMLINIFDILVLVSSEKQRCILEQNWNDLYFKTNEQQNLNNLFDETMISYGKKFNLHNNDNSQDLETLNLKILLNLYA